MANSKYNLVCGLEIHIELTTASKMFCACKNDPFNAPLPNSYTCPTCLGMPGALPVPNKKAIESIVQFGLSLGSTINGHSKFDRKHYSYPDLPKGYQISQYDLPLCIKSTLQTSEGPVRIKRIHLEEDTAKLIHTRIHSDTDHPRISADKNQRESSASWIDFNRSGVPLMELVTEPDIVSASQAKEFAKKIRTIVRYLGIANGDLEEGAMRLEANVSMKKKGEEGLPKYKVEVKNINSFLFLEKAILFEMKRQSALLDEGETPAQETRGWDEGRGGTVSQRVKEDSEDYRYFPDPDIPPIEISDEMQTRLRDTIPELPDVKIARWERVFGVEARYGSLLAEDRISAERFDPMFSALAEANISPNAFAGDIVNKKTVVVPETSVADVVSAYRSATAKTEVPEDVIRTFVAEVLAESASAVADYRSGKQSAVNFLLGAMLKKLKTKTDTEKVRRIIVELLG